MTRIAYTSARIIDSDGIADGASIYAYESSSSTPVSLFSDADFQTPVTNPYVVAAGALAPILYTNHIGDIRVRIVSESGEVISDEDPYVAYANAADLASTDPDKGAALIRRRNAALSDILPVTPNEFTGTFSARLQAAIDEVSAGGGGTVEIPAGEYVVTPATTAAGYIGSTAFGMTLKYAIEMKSNVRIVGRGAILKVADNVSSRAAPQNFAVFYSEDALSNVQFHGLTIDLNAANNYFSPDPTNTSKTQEQRYYRYHQAAIFWEGNSGKADDVLIRDCTFKNGGGVSTIICGRVGAAGVGRRWRILDSNFLELGLDTYDHSSIFLWCDDAIVDGCYWRNEDVYAPTAANRTGVNAPIETHGSNTLITNNVFENCNRGSFITENSYGRVEAVIFEGNVVRNAKYAGVDVAFDGSGGFGGPLNIGVYDNIFELSDDDTNLDGDASSGAAEQAGIAVLGLDSNVSGIDGLYLSGNVISRPVTPASGRSANGIVISLQDGGYGKVRLTDNEVSGCTRGLYVVTDTTTVCTDFESTGNRFLDPTGGTLPAVTKVGTFIRAQGGTIRRFFFDDKVLDTRSASNGWAFGIAVTETVATTVTHFEVARSAVFDRRFAVADKITGVTDLTLSKLYGVAVTGSYPNTSYGTLSGAAVAATTLPGVSPYDELVVGYDSEVTNAGGFLLMPFYSGTDEVSLAIRNVTSGTLFTTPGFTFRITAYPGR